MVLQGRSGMDGLENQCRRWRTSLEMAVFGGYSEWIHEKGWMVTEDDAGRHEKKLGAG